MVSQDGKISIVVCVDSGAKDKGILANSILNDLMRHLDGRGGGSADMAQGGGTNLAGIDQAFNQVIESVRGATR